MFKIERKKITFLIAVILIALGLVLYLRRNGEKNAEKENLITSAEAPEISKSYSSPGDVFAFDLPMEMSRTELAEETGSVSVIFKGEGEKENFQLSYTDFDEDISLTPERIRRDIPNMEIREPELISIGGAQAVAFLTMENNFATREIWFVRGGRLYQISTYPEFDEKMVEILESWKWAD